MNDLARAIEDDPLVVENVGDATLEEDAAPKHSLRGAINGYCRDCIYDPQDKGAGNWRQQVEACTVTKCSLYPVRPISKPRKTSELPLAPGDAEQPLPSTEE